jgi:CTP synthase
MQLAVVDFARHVCGLTGANSSEIEESPHPVVDLLPDQQGITDKGATMRLGAYPCILGEGTRARAVYGTETISERHRHRWEVNNKYRDTLERHGLVLSGLSPDGRLVEMIELPDHPYFVACQFHPEFKSRPLEPHPLFVRFVEAAVARRARQEERPASNGAAPATGEESASPAGTVVPTTN